jgi:hypothetical protein
MASNQSAPATDDDVKRVICGEEFCHNLLNDGIARASTTCTQYMASLTVMYKLLNRGTVMPPNIEWIRDDIDCLIPLLEAKYSNKGTLCNKYTPLMTLSKHRGWMESYNRYYHSFLIAKTAQISQAGSQKVTKKKETNWIDMQKVKDKVEELGRRIRRQIFPEFRASRRSLAQDEVKCVFQHLVLAANVLEPPKRRDWCSLPIQKLDGTFYNEAAKSPYEEFGNELVKKATDTYSMVLKTFKTAKKFGQQEFELPKRLSHYSQRSIELVPRAYFVTLLGDLGQPMNDNYWTQFIREITFSKGRHLTTNHLRHVFVTDRYDKDASLSNRQSVAGQMLHSVLTQMRSYETSLGCLLPQVF